MVTVRLKEGTEEKVPGKQNVAPTVAGSQNFATRKRF
jgi:hypothetical protein